MDKFKILTIFINHQFFNEREEFYQQLISQNFGQMNYSDVFLLGVDIDLKVKLMDWIEPQLPTQNFWEMPFRLGETLTGTIEALNYSFEKTYFDRIIHLNLNKSIKQIDYCIDFNLDNMALKINSFHKKNEHKNFIIKEISIKDLL